VPRGEASFASSQQIEDGHAGQGCFMDAGVAHAANEASTTEWIPESAFATPPSHSRSTRGEEEPVRARVRVMHAALLLLVLAGTPLESAIGAVVPKTISGFATWALPSDSVKVKGYAKSNEGIADFMRAIGTLVSTPKGLGRIVERTRNKAGMRVELFERHALLDFSAAEVRVISVQLVDAGAQGSFELHVH